MCFQSSCLTCRSKLRELEGKEILWHRVVNFTFKSKSALHETFFAIQCELFTSPIEQVSGFKLVRSLAKKIVFELLGEKIYCTRKFGYNCTQEPITKSVQLPHIPVTAAPTDLFLV